MLKTIGNGSNLKKKIVKQIRPFDKNDSNIV